jgi:transcriptional regulator with XRE-family HTH domain
VIVNWQANVERLIGNSIPNEGNSLTPFEMIEAGHVLLEIVTVPPVALLVMMTKPFETFVNATFGRLPCCCSTPEICPQIQVPVNAVDEGGGVAVGALVGAAVGATVGDAVGVLLADEVGAPVGTTVGALVATLLGCAVGVTVGVGVTMLGTDDPAPPPAPLQAARLTIAIAAKRMPILPLPIVRRSDLIVPPVNCIMCKVYRWGSKKQCLTISRLPTNRAESASVRKPVGEALRKIRLDADISIRDLSRLTGMAAGQISQIETGRKLDPGFSTVLKLANGLKISLDMLAAECTGESIIGAAERETLHYLTELQQIVTRLKTLEERRTTS